MRSGSNLENMNFKKVSVIGAAKSGIAAVKYFVARGVSVFISECCGSERLSQILQTEGLSHLEYEASGHSDTVLNSDLIILSPGVRSDLDILIKAKEAGIPVWSEMELGFRISKAPFLAVTGSSGKSTTVSLLGAAMTSAGFNAVVAGNIGLPVVSVTPELEEDSFVVAEVSSFQLETVDKFRPRVAAVLNFMKNHLDRYSGEEEYYEAKKRIAMNLGTNDFLVLNMHDSRLLAWAEQMSKKTQIIFFGHEETSGDSVFFKNGSIRYNFNGKSGIILENVSEMKLGGRHNYENACAAAAVALAAGAQAEGIAKGICSFGGLPHRLEYVGEIGNVAFYNDSKSTTAESIECALRAFDSKIHLIAGGKDKGCDFSVINEAVKQSVKSITLIGEAKERMMSQWKGLAPIQTAESLEQAVEVAFKNAVDSEKVIFSPGCSSFDMFKNFEHRGDCFRSIIGKLISQRCLK